MFESPTTADYAASDANDARRRAEHLEKRVAELERVLAGLIILLGRKGVIDEVDPE
jgi:hypothetical protein